MTLYTVVDWGGVKIWCDIIHSSGLWWGEDDIIHSSGLWWGEDML